MPVFLLVGDDLSCNGIGRRTVLLIETEVSARFYSGTVPGENVSIITPSHFRQSAFGRLSGSL
jgi:hypothetical protein